MPTAYAEEGDTITSRPDTAHHSIYHHQTPTPATDSRHHAITYHHATYNTASSSRFSAYKETKDHVAHDKTTNTQCPRQDRGWIPAPREIRLP